MPPGKGRTKEDTWKESDLRKHVKDSGDDRKKRDKDRERKHEKREINGDDERRHRRKKDDDDRKDKERKERRNREEDDRKRDERRRPPKEEDDRKKRTERGEKRREDDSKRKKPKDDDDQERRQRRHRTDNEDDDRERRRRHRNEDEEDPDRERRHRRQREEKNEDKENDREKRHRRREEKADDNEDRERRHRRNRDEDEVRSDKDRRDKHSSSSKDDRRRTRDDGEKDRRRHDDDERRKRRDDDEKKRRHRDEDDRKRHRDDDKRRDKDDDRRREKDRDRRKDDDREKRKEKEREERREKEKREEKEKKEEKKVETKEEEDDDDEYNYEEDFEDYEDDFEDDDGGNDDKDEDSDKSGDDSDRDSLDSRDTNENQENADLLRAMNAENERLFSANSRSPDSTDRSEERSIRPSRPKTAGRSFINFVSAKQREISKTVGAKTSRRAKELSQLIEMDVAKYDMFELQPVKEYEMYIKNFGGSNTKQAYVQTNDDNLDREIQTDEIEVRDKWSQQPPEDFIASGGPQDEEDKEKDDQKDIHKSDTLRYYKFIKRASQAISILLEEDLAVVNEISGSTKSDITISDSLVELEVPKFLQGRSVIYCSFSPVQSYLLLTVHTKPLKPYPARLSHCGVICLWNVNEPSKPQKLLLCESDPVCCCFSPQKATLAFAGMSDGSVVVWDLRESGTLHQNMTLEGDEWVLRFPTYSTAGVLQQESSHHSSVVSVLPIVSATDSAKASLMEPQKDTGSGLSFQLASLEESAKLHIWVVAEISNPDEAGSPSDLGLAPGGRIKLLKSSSILLESPVRDVNLKVNLRAYNMCLLPSDPNHFYVGTDSGYVIHGVRHTGRAPPKAYIPDFESPVNVVSLDFNPFDIPVFLAGCDDGTLRLHRVTSEYPLLSWSSFTNGRAICKVCWSRSRPSVFYVIDDVSTVYVWDLLEKDSEPLSIDKVTTSRVSCFCLSNDHSATGLGLPGRQPQMALTTEDERIEVHNLSKQFIVAQLDETYQLDKYLEQLV